MYLGDAVIYKENRYFLLQTVPTEKYKKPICHSMFFDFGFKIMNMIWWQAGYNFPVQSNISPSIKWFSCEFYTDIMCDTYYLACSHLIHSFIHSFIHQRWPVQVNLHLSTITTLSFKILHLTLKHFFQIQDHCPQLPIFLLLLLTAPPPNQAHALIHWIQPHPIYSLVKYFLLFSSCRNGLASFPLKLIEMELLLLVWENFPWFFISYGWLSLLVFLPIILVCIKKLS